jgi:small-conductance mechanosensitive channel
MFTEFSFAATRLAAGAVLGFAIYAIFALVRRILNKRQGVGLAEKLLDRSTGALRVFLPLLGLFVALPAALTEGEILNLARLVIRTLVIASGAYLSIRLVYGVADFIEARLGIDAPDNLSARRTLTQMQVLRSVLVSFIAFTAFIVALLYLPGARALGTGLLASAGLAGVVIGFSAQRALGNLLAGFQIAITQPIRLDDVVVVENEWGRIEEITLTYVVVKIWDERRLILPISYFLEKPFTNWTRESADILGTVFLYADYAVPIEALRAELDRILAQSEHWDGRVKGLVVTDSKERTLELRALVSASDGGKAWDLRCEVREGLVGFLQREYPDSLPRLRAELVGDRADR